MLPETANLAPGGYLVLARDRQRLIADRRLPPELVLGDYQGELDNGGDSVALLDDEGALVDVVRYDDQLPWPLGADALGAGAAWFPGRRIDKHQYRGRSLERWSFALPASEVRNWAASPTGGGTPAAGNTLSGEPPAVVMQLSPRGTVVKPGGMVPVSVTLSPGAMGELAVEYYLDDLAAPEGEPRVEIALADNGNRERTALLPALPGRINRALPDPSIAAQARPPRCCRPGPGDPHSFHLLLRRARSGAARQRLPDLHRARPLDARCGPTWAAGPTPAASSIPPGTPGCRRWPSTTAGCTTCWCATRAAAISAGNGLPLPPFPAGSGPTQPADSKALSWRLSFPSYVTLGRAARTTGADGDPQQAVPGLPRGAQPPGQQAALGGGRTHPALPLRPAVRQRRLLPLHDGGGGHRRGSAGQDRSRPERRWAICSSPTASWTTRGPGPPATFDRWTSNPSCPDALEQAAALPVHLRAADPRVEGRGSRRAPGAHRDHRDARRRFTKPPAPAATGARFASTWTGTSTSDSS